MTFTAAQHQEESSIYDTIQNWIINRHSLTLPKWADFKWLRKHIKI